jgi:hypothetical protein
MTKSHPVKKPAPKHPEWFRAGAIAPSRDSFPKQDGSALTDGADVPDWIDYLYALHNKGLVIVGGIIREVL